MTGSKPTAAALILLFLVFLTVTYDHSKKWRNPNRGDQDLDLTLGLKIRQFEALSDGYHHPLLPALVAPFAEKRLVYFAKAKLVNVAIGAVAYWVVAWVGLRMVGATPTFLALAALSPSLSSKSAEFTAEPLLLLLVTLTFYHLVRGFGRARQWMLAGGFAGLAYLTKGSALLLLVVYAASLLRVAPGRVLERSALLFPLAFLAVASPLLLYNWHAFGSPFFNYNTAHVIWLDHTEEQQVMFEKDLPTMRSYLASHSPGEVMRRFLRGLVRVRGIEWVWPFLLIFLLVPPSRLAYFRAFPEKRAAAAVGTTLVLIFYLPFAWDAAIQRGIRYLLPVFPVIFLFLVDLGVFYAARVATRLWTPPARQRLASLAVAGLLVALAVTWLTLLATRPFQAPLAITFEDRATAEVYHLLDTPDLDGKRVLFGPSHLFTGTWLFRHNVAFLSMPPRLPAPEFLPWLEANRIDYILANKHLIERRRDTLRDYLRHEPREGVKLIKLAPGWEILYQAPPPSKFILLRVR